MCLFCLSFLWIANLSMLQVLTVALFWIKELDSDRVWGFCQNFSSDTRCLLRRKNCSKVNKLMQPDVLPFSRMFYQLRKKKENTDCMERSFGLNWGGCKEIRICSGIVLYCTGMNQIDLNWIPIQLIETKMFETERVSKVLSESRKIVLSLFC